MSSINTNVNKESIPSWKSITLEDLKTASNSVWKNPLCWRTPMMSHVQGPLANVLSHLPPAIDVYLKLESAQNTYCYKIRGATYQMDQKHKEIQSKQSHGKNEDIKFVCYSGGNYGKAFATVAKNMGLSATVVMPNHVPPNRIELLEGLGAKVELHPQDDLISVVQRKVNDEGMVLMHPFDDLNLILGHGSIGFEILDDVPDPDMILVPIGGGGLISGTATAIRLSGQHSVKIFGVEPETSNVMFKSFEAGQTTVLKGAHSVAVGTCAPNSGDLTYPLCHAHVNDVLLVNDNDILRTLEAVYTKLRIVAEPTGCVALAALLKKGLLEKEMEKCLEEKANKSDTSNIKIVVVISGSNVTPEEFAGYLKMAEELSPC